MANYSLLDEDEYDQLDLKAQDRMDEILDRQEQDKPLFTERPIPKIDTGTTTIEASAPREDVIMGGSRGYGLGVEGVSRPSKYGLGLSTKEPELDKAEAVRRYVMAKRGIQSKPKEPVVDQEEQMLDELTSEPPDAAVTMGYEDPNKDFVKDSSKIYPYWENIPKDELIDPSMKEPVNSRRSPIDWRVGDPDVDAERVQRYIAREAERAPFVAARNKDNTEALTNRADRMNLVADIGQGLGQIFTAGSGVQFDPSVMNKIRERASRLPEEAQRRRKQAIDEYVLERRLGKEAVQELQDARKKDMEVQLMNPNSDVSKAVQTNFRRVYGKYLAQGGDESKAFITTDANGKSFDYLDNMPANEVFKLSEMLGDKLKADQLLELNRAKLGFDTDLGQKKLDIDDKKTQGELDLKGKAIDQKSPLVAAQIKKLEEEIKRLQAGNQAVEDGKGLPAGIRPYPQQKGATAQGGVKLSKGQEEMDKSFAKKLIDWNTNGKSGFDKSLSYLLSAEKELQQAIDSGKGDEYSGKLAAKKYGYSNGLVAAPRGLALKDAVEMQGLQAIKSILSGPTSDRDVQTAKEMAFNPNLEPEANLKKIRLGIQELRERSRLMDEQARYFNEESRGTLSGYSPTPSMRAIPQEGYRTPPQGSELIRANPAPVPKQAAPRTSGGAPAPHGKTVEQDGITYDWNGTEYVKRGR